MFKINLTRSLVALGMTSVAVLGTATAASAVTPAQTTITAVTFSGTQGSGVASPTVTITGSHFGVAPPVGTSDNATFCGDYSANGSVFGNKLYFMDDNNFEAGYGTSPSGNCVGIIIDSWGPKQIVLSFGNAYGSFAHWYLSNGDGFAISIKNGIFGGTVSGLS